ncbi:hypothetical protein [Xanthobacter pseudotagetidis]|uniref:hypothetical protein n=1 Tax=Xanthobacter pseudotagetidis TaxID=3119911 RepID=UPI003727BBF4
MPLRAERIVAAALVLVLVQVGLGPAGAEEIGVAVANGTAPTACAETDNVSLTFAAPAVTGLRIEARHPAYVGTLAIDSTAPDFTACDMANDPAVPAAAPLAGPRRTTLYETPDLWLVGFTFPSFWRAAATPVRVGGLTFEGLHLVQLWVWHKERAEEVLVVYPPDGYWRARPLPPPHLRAVAYGSSFLLGPVEEKGRPMVELKEIAFDPAAKAFTLAFADGGAARLAMTELSEARMVLEATFDRPRAGAFAALRSMYVTEANADVARLAWRTGAAGWREAPVTGFGGASDVRALWAGRLVPSAHNTSAPDMMLDRFAGP